MVEGATAPERSGDQGAAAGTRTVNLALQGGGAHGAFTWGVLDRLLEDGRLDFEGISGTSAGAMNGAMLAYGLLTGGREEARGQLYRLWRRLAKANAVGPWNPSWMSRFTGDPHLEAHPVYAGFDLLVRMMSPYQFNPLGLNPMREILRGLIDFDVLREAADVRLYVGATNVRESKLKVFKGRELSADCLVASACLPFLFQAVEIDGEHYWDGGYMGNPTIYPLIHECAARDVLIVQVTPIARPAVPTTPTAIIDRMNEIGFNGTFLRELRSLELVNRLLAAGRLTEEEAGMRALFLHRIEAEAAMAVLGVSSKLNADWGFLTELRDLGRAAASRWLEERFASVGRASSFEVERFFA
ncbi:patatin-like phospholipase family protein [Rhodospirillum centenum]|uniref:Patatin-like phospholipase, putative n=1 Tax=Rhodospirillum centenum (strain ATCC 51521 / SW) TaxID=414684 RepID=B6INQ7_RHOCS|nr:patatin-like phospholipase family protein [Rhodospirillum centenum]ACI99241.1 patatin-like phospholipase, putative [Rhodospirillum centenum SW]